MHSDGAGTWWQQMNESTNVILDENYGVEVFFFLNANMTFTSLLFYFYGLYAIYDCFLQLFLKTFHC